MEGLYWDKSQLHDQQQIQYKNPKDRGLDTKIIGGKDNCKLSGEHMER